MHQKYGWNDNWAEQVKDVRQKNPQLTESFVGRVGRVDRGACAVYLFGCGDVLEGDDRTEQPTQVTAASDSLRSQKIVAPVTGDWVMVSEDEEVGWVVDLVLDRKSAIVRRDPAIAVSEQTIVANLDVVFVVHGMDREMNLGQLERFLVLASDSGASAVILLHKCDLATAEEVSEAAEEISALAQGVKTVATSVMGNQPGLEEVRAEIQGNKTGVLVGVSGAGKSSITEALMEGETEIAVGETGRHGGRHVTVVRDLYLVPSGGLIIDTPGLRGVGLWAADVALDEVFSDIAGLAESCKFRDCTHRIEPGCVVTEAVSRGEISADRLERYQRLWDEVAEQNEAREEKERMRSRGRHRVVRTSRVRRKRKK